VAGDRIMRWDECTGGAAVFRAPSGHANGLARDRQGRLVACEHLGRRVTRTEHDGSITVLADRFEGGRLNSPNDVVCRRDGSLWFTDPPFGILGHWEGEPAEPELPFQGVFRIDPASGALRAVITDLAGPNGLAFSPDDRVLYVVESRARPHRRIVAWDVDAAGAVSGRRVLVDAAGPGALDGIAVDVEGNLWCGWGSDGSAGADPASLDGVRVFDPQGVPIGHVHLPERCANVCFGGRHGNRLFMAASRSLYALHVNTRGAAWGVPT
jgi:gluconolactonase